MQLVIVSFFVFLMVSIGKGELRPEELECINELKINKSLVEDNEAFVKVTPVDNEELNRYFECSWEKQRYLLENGTINWNKLDKAVEDYKQEDLKKIQIGSGLELIGETAIVIFAMVSVALKVIIHQCHKQQVQGHDLLGTTIAKLQNCIAQPLFGK